MSIEKRTWTCALSLLFAAGLGATSVPSMSFEELVDQSETVVSGQVVRSWSAWDNEHKYIWTHYEIAVTSAQKGTPGPTVVVSEPGGVVGDRGFEIAGTTAYATGEKVVIFLQKMPNGFLRTTGWGQGKYTLDNAGRLHGAAVPQNLEIQQADQKAGTGGRTSLRTLDGISVVDLRARIAARLSIQTKGVAK